MATASSISAFPLKPGVADVIDPVPTRWSLSKEGFDRFLACLNPDRESAGRQYELIRAKLISYFDWRDCPFPEEHADEAINRVIKKLDAGEEFRDLATYLLGVARMMLLEIARTREKERVAIEQAPIQQQVDDDSHDIDQRVDCLTKCLAALPDRGRYLITEYYNADGPAKIKRRKQLAEGLGLQPNALRIRACRVRARLEECMKQCLINKSRNEMFPDYTVSNE